MMCNNIHCLEKPEKKESHTYHQFVITCINRAKLEIHLKNFGVQSLIHYPVPIHLQKANSYTFRRDPKGLHNAERHAQTCISLPINPQMTISDQNKVIDSINAFKL